MISFPKMPCFSSLAFVLPPTDGSTDDWCISLPVACITSLRHFHVEFRLFCKDKFAADFLYQECCYEFDLLSKG
jgi:hypothetical protein